MKKIFIIITTFVLFNIITFSQDKSPQISQAEKEKMTSALEADSLLVRYINWVGEEPLKIYERFKFCNR